MQREKKCGIETAQLKIKIIIIIKQNSKNVWTQKHLNPNAKFELLHLIT